MPTDITIFGANRKTQSAYGAGSTELGCGRPIKLTHLAELTAYLAAEKPDTIFQR